MLDSVSNAIGKHSIAQWTIGFAIIVGVLVWFFTSKYYKKK